MYTEDRKSLGKLRILLESNREYYCIFQQTAHESGSYVCTEQTETALGQHLLDLLESSRELIGQIAARYHAIDDYLTRDYMDYEKIQGYLLLSRSCIKNWPMPTSSGNQCFPTVLFFSIITGTSSMPPENTCRTVRQ